MNSLQRYQKKKKKKKKFMMTQALLQKYHHILDEQGPAQYLDCKLTPVTFALTESTNNLWCTHDKALHMMNVQNTPPKQSLLDLKIELANRLFQSCSFCEHRCKVNRRITSGKCGVRESHIASEFLHFEEETVLVPSYTIFFSGCTFHCVFCQNWDISQIPCGIPVEPQRLVTAIEQRKKQGARNVNWVGGDPTSNLLYILEVLERLDCNIAQVWNSNMYCSEETMKLLHGVIDVYLTDFKYGNDCCAKRLSKVDGYTAVVKRNHILTYQHGEVIVRHLVLPNHRECCSKPIIRYIVENLPNTIVNIMAQYRPEYKANEYIDISRPVSHEEVLQVKEYAESLGIHIL
jgi:putative pyruvate formate lyase activating enzyme